RGRRARLDRPAQGRPRRPPPRPRVARLVLPVGLLPGGAPARGVRGGVRDGADGRTHAGRGRGAQGRVREEGPRRRRVREEPGGAPPLVLPPDAVLRRARPPVPGGPGGVTADGQAAAPSAGAP